MPTPGIVAAGAMVTTGATAGMAVGAEVQADEVARVDCSLVIEEGASATATPLIHRMADLVPMEPMDRMAVTAPMAAVAATITHLSNIEVTTKFPISHHRLPNQIVTTVVRPTEIFR
jgi:hypothetical protein